MFGQDDQQLHVPLPKGQQHKENKENRKKANPSHVTATPLAAQNLHCSGDILQLQQFARLLVFALAFAFALPSGLPRQDQSRASQG